MDCYLAPATASESGRLIDRSPSHGSFLVRQDKVALRLVWRENETRDDRVAVPAHMAVRVPVIVA